MTLTLRSMPRVRGWCLASVVVLLSLAVAGCSSGDGDSQSTPSASPPRAELGVTEYQALFNRMSLDLTEITRVLVQVSLFVASNPDAATEIEDDIRLLRRSYQQQLDGVQALEPVPPSVEEAHRLLEDAIERYIEATSLLLPAERNGSDRFDYSQFQDTMLSGGMSFHGAGAALP